MATLETRFRSIRGAVLEKRARARRCERDVRRHPEVSPYPMREYLSYSFATKGAQ